MAIGNRHWTVDERVFLSLYGGFALPVWYVFAVIVIVGLFGAHLGERAKEYLVLPLGWPASVIELFYHPRLEAVGDVFDAAATEFIGIAAIDFFTYGLCVYILLSLHNRLNKVAAGPWQSSA